MDRLMLVFVVSALVVTTACAPEVGSERWCRKMADTPKADWSMNDARAYAQHCILGEEDEE